MKTSKTQKKKQKGLPSPAPKKYHRVLPEGYEVRFSPDGRYSVQKVTVQLYTEFTHRLLSSHFNTVQNALFFLDVIYPTNPAGRGEVCDAVNDALQARFAKVEETLATEVAQLRVILKSEGVDSVPSYTIESTHDLPSYSPMMTRYVALVSQIDDMLRLVEALWHAAYFTSQIRARFFTKWRNAMVGLSREIYGLRRRVANYDASRAAEESRAPISDKSPEEDIDYSITDDEDPDDTGVIAVINGVVIDMPKSKLDSHLARAIALPGTNPVASEQTTAKAKAKPKKASAPTSSPAASEPVDEHEPVATEA